MHLRHPACRSHPERVRSRDAVGRAIQRRRHEQDLATRAEASPHGFRLWRPTTAAASPWELNNPPLYKAPSGVKWFLSTSPSLPREFCVWNFRSSRQGALARDPTSIHFIVSIIVSDCLPCFRFALHWLSSGIFASVGGLPVGWEVAWSCSELHLQFFKLVCGVGQ